MRVYLASTCEGMTKAEREEAIAKAKPKYCLETFFNGERKCKQVLSDVGTTENFLLDSGAFSFMSGAECSKKTLTDYCHRYIDFINQNNIKYYFELDVDTIFGLPFVEQLREMCIKETGITPIVVWHKGRGVQYWKDMVSQYKYIAIGGLVFHVKQSEWENIKKLVIYARKHNVKVHGLGFTKTKILPEFPFYSVDSAAWGKGAALGQYRHFFNGQYIDQKKIQSNGHHVKLGKLIGANMTEWAKYQKYMDSKKW